jgi:hypothetical protein
MEARDWLHRSRRENGGQPAPLRFLLGSPLPICPIAFADRVRHRRTDDRRRKTKQQKQSQSMATASEIETRNVGSDLANRTSSPKARGWSNFVFELVLLLLWIGGCAIALYLKRSQLLISLDGGFMRSLAHSQFQWRVPIFSSSLDFSQGLGDIFFQVNFTMFPAFIGARFFSERAAPIIVYLVIVIEVTFAIRFFARCLGVARTASIAAAMITVLIFFPFSRPTLIYGIMAVSPLVGTGIAAALTMGGAFIRFGRARWPTDLGLATLIFALLAWTALSGVTVLILSAPFLVLCAFSSVIAAATRAERWRKIVLVFAISAFLGATGPVLYLIGIVIDSAAAAFPSELANDRATFTFASILFHWRMFGPTGPLLVFFAIAGSVLSIFDRSNRTLRFFAITLLTYLASRLTFAALTIEFDFWRGPSPLYFEFFVIPLYTIFAVSFVTKMIDLAWRSRSWRAPSIRWAELSLVLVSAITAILLASMTRSNHYGFEYPPRPTPFTKLMAEAAAMPRGAQFRGRAVNMIGQAEAGPVDWFKLFTRDRALTDDIGNEMRLTGLRAFEIPALFQYTPTMTPAFYAITSRLLALPGDKQMRSVSVLRRVNLRVLEMLGVRFVITDALVNEAARLRSSMVVKGATLYLYETERPNLGDYSPTVVRGATTAADTINRLSDAAFDPSREVVADIQGGGEDLVPAANARLSFDGIALHIAAESTGRSILLLPLEYSKCLKITSAQPDTPLIFRADLLETGVMFSQRIDASISLRTGPFFLNPGCRLEDYFDMKALRIGETPPPTAPAGVQ